MENKAASSRRHFWLRSLYAWWTQELAALVPAAARAWYLGQGNTLFVRLGEDGIQFLRREPASLREIAQHPLPAELPPPDRKNQVARLLAELVAGKTHQLALCLPADKVLRKQIRLPLAVEENLRQALTFELDRQTPFRPEQVYFDYRIADRLPAAQQLLVELVVIPREIVERHVRQAAELGLPVGAAVLADDLLEEGRPPMNFLPALTSHERSRQRLWTNLAFLALTLTLLAGALALPLWQKRATAIQLNAKMEEARQASRRTEALRDRLDALVAEYNFTASQKAAQLPTFTLVNQLSRLLPDDTWVSQFDVTGNEVQIQGETGSSSKLMELAENSGFLREAGYKSPLTQIPGTTLERFHIAAKSKPLPPPDNAAGAAASPASPTVASPTAPPAAAPSAAQRP